MRSLRLLGAAALGVTSLFAASARADAPSVLVRLLARKSAAHALADPSGRVPVMVTLPAGTDARALGLFPLGDGLATIRLAPGDVDLFASAFPELGFFVGPPRHALLDVSSKWTNVNAYTEATGQDGAGVVVGVIDTGIDISHTDFRDADGKTRIAWLLRGGAPAGLHPELEAQYGCSDPDQSACAIYSAADIDAILAGTGTGDPRDSAGHGTHVASIAAGNGGLQNLNPAGQLGAPCATGSDCDAAASTCASIDGEKICTRPCTGGCGVDAVDCRAVDGFATKMCARRPPRYVGMAPGATLVVAAPAPPGGGFYDPDLVRSAQFVFERADALQMPAVLNLSVGGDFGPHDGSSLLEKGLADLVGDDKKGRVIVVAAGNSGALYSSSSEKGPLGTHTEAHVSEHGVTRVPILAGKSADGRGYVWVTFRPGDEVSVGLEGPGGETWIGLTAPGDDAGEERSDGTTGAVVNNKVDGKTQLTADTNGAIVAFDGAWEAGDFAVLLQGRGDAQLWLVGEGDASNETGGGLLFHKAIRQGSINVPASHPRLLAVGCTVNRLTWTPLGDAPLKLTSLGGIDDPEPDSLCYFSSAGPTPFGIAKPELVAPGAFVAGAMGVDADPRTPGGKGGIFDAPGCPGEVPCYLVDERHAITAGTSMSAPHVAGAVALLLQRDPTLTQARATEVLQAGAAYPSGLVQNETQLGVGELDMVGALRALDEMEVPAGEPDAAASWYVLSSAYARPDPSWPVYGTIELRLGDGTVASGIDGSNLQLVVRGGAVVEPLANARHGMFRFAVAGRRGSGGEVMTIDVLYKGVSICAAPGQTGCGPRALPIGNDIWSSNGELEGVGGACGCEVPGLDGPTSGRGVAGLAAALVAGLAVRRRRAAPGPRPR